MGWQKWRAKGREDKRRTRRGRCARCGPQGKGAAVVARDARDPRIEWRSLSRSGPRRRLSYWLVVLQVDIGLLDVRFRGKTLRVKVGRCLFPMRDKRGLRRLATSFAGDHARGFDGFGGRLAIPGKMSWAVCAAASNFMQTELEPI